MPEFKTLKEKMRWIYYADFLDDEFRQCADEGKPVQGYKSKLAEIKAMDGGAEKEIRAKELALEIENLPVNERQALSEPEDYAGIRALLPKESARVYSYDPASLETKIESAWRGRLAGCVLGIPMEGWLHDKIKNYLKETGQLPIINFIKGSVSKELWEKYGVSGFDPFTPYDRQTTCWAENIGGALPVDDDINYMFAGLKTLERFGKNFTSCDMADTWLHSLPAFHTCTAERAAYRNLLNGILPPDSAKYGNPYREWIGAQIRADIFGYTGPGNPFNAARMAFNDGSVSHTKNGIYGEMYIAAISSLCYSADMTMAEVIRTALLQIPSESRLANALRTVTAKFENGGAYGEIIDNIHSKYDERDWFDWCHVIPNAMIVTANLLFWHSSFAVAISNTLLCGFDTDCNCATVGSILGLYNGCSITGKTWFHSADPIIRSSVHNFEETTIAEAVAKTKKIVLLT